MYHSDMLKILYQIVKQSSFQLRFIKGKYLEKYISLNCTTPIPMKHLQSDKTRPLTLRDSLMEFYEKHNPDKIKSIDVILKQNFFSENFEKMTVTEFF